MSDLQIAGHDQDEMDFAKSAEVARSFDHMLQALDPNLRLVWVKHDAKNFSDPGRWHIVRFHPNPELVAYWVVQNPDGSYCEPTERHLERLRQMDSHTRDVMEDIRQRRKAKAAARRKLVDERRREFREKLTERLEHIASSKISVPRAPSDLVVAKTPSIVTVTGEKPKKSDLILPAGAKVGRL